MDERAKLKRPCRGCPFSRKTSPEYLKARGENVRRFIGQAVGPFLLPCHHPQDAVGWARAMDPTAPQCAGAAMYRDLIGVADMMPAAFMRLEGDPTLVFDNASEYMAHHDGCTVDEAYAELRRKTPVDHLRDELARSGVRQVKG